MKLKILGVLVASIFSLPVYAEGMHGSGSGSAPTSSSTSTAAGGAGGAGGAASGGSATGGSATGGSSNAAGNTSSVNVSVAGGGSAGPAAAELGAVGDPGSSAYNTKGTVDYGGSYTVKSVPSVLAPSLTATLSDTCMGSASFGLSFVGFGATGGSTIVDDACVRRLDSREFRAMGMGDVALALLCQSVANRRAVEATGRSCPGMAKEAEIVIPSTAVVYQPASTVAVNQPAISVSQLDMDQRAERYTDPIIRKRLGLEPLADTSSSK